MSCCWHAGLVACGIRHMMYFIWRVVHCKWYSWCSSVWFPMSVLCSSHHSTLHLLIKSLSIFYSCQDTPALGTRYDICYEATVLFHTVVAVFLDFLLLFPLYSAHRQVWATVTKLGMQDTNQRMVVLTSFRTPGLSFTAVGTVYYHHMHMDGLYNNFTGTNLCPPC